MQVSSCVVSLLSRREDYSEKNSLENTSENKVVNLDGMTRQ